LLSVVLTILGKTIAWCILLGLSVLAFGAFMSHRFRIYFALRHAWYRLQQWECTQRLGAKLSQWWPWGGASGRASAAGTSINTILFDNDMSEGLLFSSSSSSSPPPRE